MMRFKNYGPIPKNIKRDYVHAITCRGTFFGIQQNKSTIVLFQQVLSVSLLVGHLKKMGYSHFPMKVEKIKVSDAEKICHMHYLDLYIVYNLLNAPGEVLHADCYSLEISSLPDRELLNYQFEKYLID